MTTNDPAQPEQRVEALLAEREEYIRQQEEVRNRKIKTELQLLLLMIDGRSAEDPHLVRQIRKTHTDEDGLPSFNTLYDERKRIGFELDRLHTHQQRVEIELATCVLDTDEMVVAELDEAIETVLSMRGESSDDLNDTSENE